MPLRYVLREVKCAFYKKDKSKDTKITKETHYFIGFFQELIDVLQSKRGIRRWARIVAFQELVQYGG